MYLAVFLCLLFLFLDFVVFSATYRCDKAYKRDIKVISDNLETLITSVESKKLSNVWVAVDYRHSSENPDIVHEYCTIFLDKKTGGRLVVPDSLYMDYHSDDDYEEL